MSITKEISIHTAEPLGSRHSFSVLSHLFAIREQTKYKEMITYQSYLKITTFEPLLAF